VLAPTVKRCLYILVTFTVFLLTPITGLRETSQAQDEASLTGMASLIEKLDQRTKDEPGFTVGFRFVTPLLEDELSWSIPLSDREHDVERWIGEVEQDYLCFYETAGSAEIVRCTPFSNIAAITYLNNP